MSADDERWLNDDETEAWIPLVAVLLLLPAAFDAQLQADSNLTFYEYVVLSALSEIGRDGLRITDLAAVTSAAPSRLSQVVSRMEQREWVQRRPDPQDGRATRVHLEAAGKKVLEQAAPGHADAVRRHIFDGLTLSQVKQLRTIALRIASTLVPADALIYTRDTFTGEHRTAG